MPCANFALAELAAAAEAETELALLLLLFLVPRMPPTTAPAMTRTATGMPNLIQLLVPCFLGLAGVMKPVDWLKAGSSLPYIWCRWLLWRGS